MYVCMYVCVMNVCMVDRMYVCVYGNVCVYVCMYVRMYVCTYVHMCIFLYGSCAVGQQRAFFPSMPLLCSVFFRAGLATDLFVADTPL